MTTENPAEQLAQTIASLQNDVNSLQSKARLADTRNNLENFDMAVNGLPAQLQELRTRGYVFEKDLEAEASALASRWAPMHSSILSMIDSETAQIQPSLAATEAQMLEVTSWRDNPPAVQPMIVQARSMVDNLNSKVDAVQRNVTGMYDAFKAEVDKLDAHLKQIDWTLQQLAEASFRLLATEGAINAVQAVWCKQGKQTSEDPSGVLYLTDQRVLFEQKQEIATKKILFIATEKQKVQKLALDAPTSAIDSAKATKQGLLGHEDHLDVAFATGAPVRSAHFHINGQDSNAWRTLLERAKTRDFDAGRVTPIDQAQSDRVKAAPSKCPNCGGAITQAILRGMDSIKCEFCGTLIRL
jgi:hypothetical protein